MRSAISFERLLVSSLAIVCGTLAFAATAQAESKSWSLAGEFPLTRTNPTPDKYGNKNVWYYESGEPMATKYHKMLHFFDAAEIEAQCGTKEFFEFNRIKQIEGQPAIWYNAGPTVEEGQSICAPHATYATKTVFVHPEVAPKPGDAVIRWRSPITGTVTVTGSVQPVDSLVFGIDWEFDQGSTVLVGPTESFEDSLASFGPLVVAVNKKESLYLEVGRALSRQGYNDSTAVTLTITSS